MHEFDWSFDLTVLWLIYRMRDKRKRKTKAAKKADVINKAVYLGMDREEVIRAIKELYQMGEIIEIKGEDADGDLLRVVNDKRIARFRCEELLENPMNSED